MKSGRIPKIVGILGVALAALGGTAYWYVFVAGAPQFDPPQVEFSQAMQQEGLTFQVNPSRASQWDSSGVTV